MASKRIFRKLPDHRKSQILLSTLIAIGFIIRIVGISSIPSGLNQDEASIGYESFSILSTGLDRNANSFPVHLVSWGSGQNALYAYLSMPFVSILGLNALSIRIVNVIFSCFSIIIFYLLFKLIFDKKKALVALALLTICPWSIMSARWGLESNIFPTLFLTGVYFLLKSIYTNPKYLLISFLFFSISLYSYGTSYLIVPLFLLFTIPYLIYKEKINIKILGCGFILLLIISLPIILFVIINHLNLYQIQIFNMTIPKLDSNRTTAIFNLFTPDVLKILPQNIFRLLNIIFIQSDGNQYNAMPYFGTIYGISLPFLLIGLYNVLVNKKYKTEIQHYIFCVWFLCSIILGITSHININRLNIIFFPILYFVTLGIFDINRALKAEYQNYYHVFVLGIYSVLFAFFIGYYFFIDSKTINSNYSTGLGDAIQYAEKSNKNDTINITTNTINMPYIYVCFYNQLNPNIFREKVIYKYNAYSNGFREVQSLGRYTFGTEKKFSNTICILSNEELKYKDFPISFSKKFGNYSVIKFRPLRPE